MTVDHVLIITMALAIVAILLMILGQAFGQFDSVLKTVLRPPRGEAKPEAVQLRLIAPAAVAVAIAALSVLIVFFKH